MAKRKDSDTGFLHSVSPLKKSSRTNKDYFVCSLQTSPSKFTRVVGFDKKNHEQALHYNKTGSPLKLVGVKEQEGQLFINSTTSIIQVNATDVDFESKPPQDDANTCINNPPETVAANITLAEMQKLTRNQRVNVTGVVTLGDLPPKEVTKRNNQVGKVKEDCIIEDDTGYSTIHLWDDIITKIHTSKCYSIKNLSVKNFSGNALLGTTPDTTISESDTVIQGVKGKDLLSDGEMTETISEFKFVDKLNIFTSCQIKACNKRMPYVLNCKVITCPNCGTSQRFASAKSGITARLCAEIDGKDMWFTAFNDVMQKLLLKVNLTMQAKSHEITEALLGLENISLCYDTKSNFIKDIVN